MTNEPAVELSGVTIRRGRRLILKDITLSVAAGSMVGVLGPNGAGKSTLLAVIAGMLSPVTGKVRVLGEEVKHLRGRKLLRLRRRIGVLPQVSEVNELAPLSVREVVEISRVGLAGLGRRLGPADREAVDRGLARFQLEPLAHLPYHRLSTGQQRKTQLARVFAQAPELLLLDEPMASLDLFWITTLRREIPTLAHELGATVLFVAHEPHHLPHGVNQIALLSAGRLRALGPAENVLSPQLLAEVYTGPLPPLATSEQLSPAERGK